MSLLPITIYGDKILRKKVDKVKEVDFKTIELIKNMFDTMKNASGIGLAANQVGVDKSIFVIDISPVEGYEDHRPTALINPEIVYYSPEKVFIEEGCLSIPDIKAEVERPETIRIKFQDADLIEHEIETNDLLSRVMQHEFDHLQGVLFIDKIDDRTRKKMNSELIRIKKRTIAVDYPITEHADYQLL
jgi:peptide deformylase